MSSFIFLSREYSQVMSLYGFPNSLCFKTKPQTKLNSVDKVGRDGETPFAVLKIKGLLKVFWYGFWFGVFFS